jgi:transposase
MGLICNAQGCQIGVEVYTGNTKDETTVMDKVHEIKARYGIDRVIFVGDHGMIRRSNIEALKDEEDLHTIGALARAEMMTLLKEKVIDRELSDERSIHEVADAANPTRLYCLWRNPQKAQRERKTRQRLLDHRNRPGQDRGLPTRKDRGESRCACRKGLGEMQDGQVHPMVH